MRRKLLALIVAVVLSIGALTTFTACGEKICNHVYSGNTCTECGAHVPSEGLKYTLSTDGDYYIVSGMGSCMDTELVIPNTYKEKPVKVIGTEAFKGNTKITSLEIHDGVEFVLPYAFKNCTALKSVKFSKTLEVVDWCSFEGCESLIEVDIPNKVNKIEYGAFRECYALEKVSIGSGVKTIGTYAFASCTSLITVNVPSSVKYLGDRIFNNCFKLIEIQNNSKFKIQMGSEEDGGIALYAKNIIKKKGSSKLFTTDDGFTFYNDNGAYYLMGKLGGVEGELKFPSDFKGEKYSIYDYAFQRKNKITSVEIPNGVTGVGKYAFGNCINIEKVKIGDDLEKIDEGAFYTNLKLTEVNLGKKVNYIGNNAFMGSTLLSTMTFDGTTAEWISAHKGNLWNTATQISSVACKDGPFVVS